MGPGPQLRCLNTALSGPVFDMRLQLYCVNRALLGPVLGMGPQMYCANRTLLVRMLRPVHVLGMPVKTARPMGRR